MLSHMSRRGGITDNPDLSGVVQVEEFLAELLNPAKTAQDGLCCDK